jgi:predicted DNA-binding transcriptional regulator AlpA
MEARDRALAYATLLSAQQVAEMIGRKKSTVMSWARSKRSGFPAPVRLNIDAAFQWRLSDLQDFVEQAIKHPPAKRPYRGGTLLEGKKRPRTRLPGPEHGGAS